LEEKAGALVGQVQCCAWLTAEDLRPRSHADQGRRWRTTVEDAARSRRRGNRIRGSETGRGGTGSRGARPHGKFFFLHERKVKGQWARREDFGPARKKKKI